MKNVKKYSLSLIHTIIIWAKTVGYRQHINVTTFKAFIPVPGFSEYDKISPFKALNS